MPVTSLPSRGDQPGEGASAKTCDASETVVHWMFQAGYSEAAALVTSVAEGDPADAGSRATALGGDR
ncbi:hypothetical protein E3T39_11285 [Cryobacterium suzukii]|uniref:Uncharacterized protein n=1 Tax=Cryobacterium suzukii TaxID=1259198 RepID=A0A4R9AFD3_9MICO|nr:hypothetical protein [Cryobacterium suzukii]TFD58939.1 hypothetical protein E3T39_11285 [Cryobacterium suzukii]